MADDDSVLFIRGEDDSSPDDVWDDSALIKAYDKAINLAKEEVSKRLGISVQEENTCTTQKKSHSQKYTHQTQKKKWVDGAPCRAIYSDDGEYYEARIQKVFENTGTCIVKFIGYNNTEKVDMSTLLDSEGLQSQIAQEKDAALAKQNTSAMDFEEVPKSNGYPENLMDYETNQTTKSFKNTYMPGPSFDSSLGAMPPAPPLPPQLLARLPENDADALSSMLMSWYMSGFHTGFYHGLKQAQSSQGQRKS